MKDTRNLTTSLALNDRSRLQLIIVYQKTLEWLSAEEDRVKDFIEVLDEDERGPGTSIPLLEHHKLPENVITRFYNVNHIRGLLQVNPDNIKNYYLTLKDHKECLEQELKDLLEGVKGRHQDKKGLLG